MTETQEIFFGDKSTFAIRYVRGYVYKKHPDWLYAFLHLVLGGQLIGDKDESCATEKSWFGSLEEIRDNIMQGKFQHPEFKGRSDDELFELIYKANQNEEDFKPEYAHLPQLDRKIWDVCCFNMDETTDGYYLVLVEVGDRLKFFWEYGRGSTPETMRGKRFTIAVDKKVVLEAIDYCLDYVRTDYKNYPLID